MIRLLPTQLFVTMDEVQEYETRQALRKAQPVENEADEKKSQAARIVGQDLECQELQTPRPASPAPQTPERHQPARKSLVIRSSSQPAARSLPDKPAREESTLVATVVDTNRDPVHAASEPANEPATDTPSPWREARRERSSTTSADDEPR